MNQLGDYCLQLRDAVFGIQTQIVLIKYCAVLCKTMLIFSLGRGLYWGRYWSMDTSASCTVSASCHAT